MKKLFNIILITGTLLCFGCKKESTGSVYTINSVERPNTFACKYTATSPGKPDIIFWEECGKYKARQTFIAGL
jgi:hypothetical protein